MDKKILKNDNFTGHYVWSEIYELLNNHLQAANPTNTTVKYLEESFLKFMQQKNMMPFKKFTEKDVQIAPLVPDLYERLEKFLNYAKQSQSIINFCSQNKLEIGQPYFDADRNLAVYFSNKGKIYQATVRY